MKKEIHTRSQENVRRVKSLLSIYTARKPGSGRRPVADADLLRAATVFLHATLEDLLRSVAGWKLPGAPREVLDTIPLVGLSTRGRPEKFFLGELAAHKSKSVQDLINSSVGEYLSQATFNSTSDVAALIKAIGIDVGKVNGRFGDLQQLMARRHHIVHQADLNTKSGVGQHQARSIGTKSVNKWLDAVEAFANDLLAQL